MSTVRVQGSHRPATIMRESTESIDRNLDRPRVSDFIKPYFFFSSRVGGEVSYVSPSFRDVLGYDATAMVGIQFSRLMYPGCPLNQDELACQRLDLRNGRSIHVLRSVRNREGCRRVLSIHTVGVSETQGGPELRRHNIVLDVTETVETYARSVAKYQKLAEAESRLTVQERQVADQILHGSMNREIAEELQISERTVDRRRATIMKQLNVSTTSELVSHLVQRSVLQSNINSVQDAHWRQARNSGQVAEAARVWWQSENMPGA